jgi:hypothetical protein
MIVCIVSVTSLLKCANSLHQICIFTNRGFSPQNPPVGMHTWCRPRAYFADFVSLCADLVHTFSEKVCIWLTMHTWPECASLQKIGMHTLHTFFWCAKSAQCFQPSQANLAKHLAIQHLCTRRASPPHAPSSRSGARSRWATLCLGDVFASRSCSSWITASRATAQRRAECRLNAHMLHTQCIPHAHQLHWLHTKRILCAIKCTQNKTICVGRFN